ncbi:LOB domain-containing protein 40 [Stylosanthes scabra]|uniref:LOB domain-containing protein 40 n=1 Tax=Stylosanthes scabra TaxID=79078 RepID=A0ABU6S7X5_9FABA|nr:LOB domain-containing protein 40 [Stylosanthes scabra]
MRLSCNGCRVLRKGCSRECPIRPCIQWIRSPQSQANATIFLAKFYGRAGLINLIHAAAPHLRPAAFRSLLHEACGRIVDPILGCTGLLSSGRWHLCEAAVGAVLNGAPIGKMSAWCESASSSMLRACDIRHVANKEAKSGLHKVKGSSSKGFKRNRGGKAGKKGKEIAEVSDEEWASGLSDHRSSLVNNCNGESCSVETETETAVVEAAAEACDDGGLDLSLTLGCFSS